MIFPSSTNSQVFYINMISLFIFWYLFEIADDCKTILSSGGRRSSPGPFFSFFFFLTPHPLFTSIKIRFRPKKEIRKNLFFLLFFGAVVVAAGQVYLVFVVFFFYSRRPRLGLWTAGKRHLESRLGCLYYWANEKTCIDEIENIKYKSTFWL